MFSQRAPGETLYDRLESAFDTGKGQAGGGKFRSFDAYLKSLDHLVTIGEPEQARIRAAYGAGLAS